MAIFGRKKDDTPSTAGTPGPRDADIAMPNPRPANASASSSFSPPGSKENPAMSQTTRPPAAPAPNTMAPRPMGPAGGVGVPARPQQPLAAPGTDRRTLTVGKGITVQGTISDCERLVVEGTVESQMLQAAELAVGSTGIFRGEVQVEDAEIAGLFDGTLTARGNLTIRASGRVNGVARSKRLAVEDGGQLTGRMEMLTEGSMPPMTAPAAPASMSAAPAAPAPAAPARPAAVG